MTQDVNARRVAVRSIAWLGAVRLEFIQQRGSETDDNQRDIVADVKVCSPRVLSRDYCGRLLSTTSYRILENRPRPLLAQVIRRLNLSFGGKAPRALLTANSTSSVATFGPSLLPSFERHWI